MASNNMSATCGPCLHLHFKLESIFQRITHTKSSTFSSSFPTTNPKFQSHLHPLFRTTPCASNSFPKIDSKLFYFHLWNPALHYYHIILIQQPGSREAYRVSCLFNSMGDCAVQTWKKSPAVFAILPSIGIQQILNALKPSSSQIKIHIRKRILSWASQVPMYVPSTQM